MVQYPPKLELILYNLERFHRISAPEKEQIYTAYSFVEEVSNRCTDELLLDYSAKVAQYIASWRFDFSVVTAALLHRIVAYYRNLLNPSTLPISEFTASILKGYADIYRKLQEATVEDAQIGRAEGRFQLNCPYPEPLYILIAEHIVLLSEERENNDDGALLLAQRTKQLLLPEVKKIHAYKMADMLEECCFRIENYSIYVQMKSAIEEVNTLSCCYRKQFVARLQQIFDSHSNILPESLKNYQPYTKCLKIDKRSLVSIYRFVTSMDTSSAIGTSIEDDIKKVKNICRTAYYDLTLVIDDSFSREEDCSNVDLVMEYYDQSLRRDGVCLYGCYPTTSGDSYYLLLSDPMKNMYRLFVKSDYEYQRFLYGDIVDREKYEIVHAYPKTRDKIKIFRRDGSPDLVDKGATVLDFAFKIHEDLGLHFGYAKLNNNGKAMPPYTVISNGDIVEIVKSDRIMVELNWFRYVKTDLALNYLIKYYKTHMHRINC